MSTHNVFKSVLIVVLATGAGRLTGFFREVVLAARFGTGPENDALVIALSLPDIVLGMVAVSLVTVFIPVYTEARLRKGEDAGSEFIGNLLAVVLLITLMASVLAYFSGFAIISRIAGGFSREAKLLAVGLFNILLPIVVLSSIISVLTGYLQARFHFAVPAFISIPLNFTVIGCAFFLSGGYGIMPVAWGYTAGTVLQLLITVIAVKKTRLKIRLGFSAGYGYLKSAAAMFLPVLFFSLATNANNLAANFLASGISAGSVSALYYSYKLIIFPHSVFVMSMAAVVFPVLATAAAGNDREGFVKALAGWTNNLLIFVIPVTAGFIVLRDPVIRLVYQHGMFDHNSVAMTSGIIKFYALALPAYALNELYTKAFYALKDTKTPMIIGVAAMLVNISLNFVLVKQMGYGGLALAAAISANLTAAALFIGLNQRGILYVDRKRAACVLKYVLSAVIMGFLVHVTHGCLSGCGEAVSGMICAAAGCVFYFALIRVTCPDIFRSYYKRLLAKVRVAVK